MSDTTEPTSPSIVYDLMRDSTLLAQIEHASLSSKPLGLSREYGIVGSGEWWSAVRDGEVKVEKFVGIVLRVDGGAMGDSAVVRIQGTQEVRSWVAWEGFLPQLIGKQVVVRYAWVRPKCPPTPDYMIDLLVEVRVVS